MIRDLLEELGIEYPTIRQRVLAQRATLLERYLREASDDRVFQDARKARVLPKIYIENLRAASLRLREEIGLREPFNKAERVERFPIDEIKDPIARRNAVIEGHLERERLQRARLSRGAFDRAKAIAASRRKKLGSERAVEVHAGELRKPIPRVRGAIEKEHLEESTLCAWWHRRARNRKRTLIARNLRKRKGVSFEQRHSRKHIKHIVMHSLCGGH